MVEPTDNETLVDSKLLSYSYLEAGMIETFAWYADVLDSCSPNNLRTFAV